jgi:mono/diheme cytochrome c family protein
VFGLVGSILATGCAGNKEAGSQTVSAQPSSSAVKRSIAGSTVGTGWYSAEQAAQGEALFKQKCAVCHGAKLEGGAGPALAGNQFFLR